MSTETIEMQVDKASAVLHEFSQLVTNQIFVLDVIPRPTPTFEREHTAAVRDGKVLNQVSYVFLFSYR